MEKSFAQLLQHAWRVGDLTLFKAPTGGAFDRLNWQNIAGNLGGGGAVLELTDT